MEELEKASSAVNNENSQLKSQIEKLTVELNEYKKRVTLLGSGARQASSGSRNQSFGASALQNLNDVNFQFEFPKFGTVNGDVKRSTTYPSPSSTSSNGQISTQEKTSNKAAHSSSKSRESSNTQHGEPSAKTVNTSPYESTYGGNVSRTSLDSTTFSVNGANGASPSASSNSNMGASSSCGTSPEPCTQSPVGFKPVDTLTTIGEEQQPVASDSHTGALPCFVFSP